MGGKGRAEMRKVDAKLDSPEVIMEALRIAALDLWYERVVVYADKKWLKSLNGSEDIVEAYLVEARDADRARRSVTDAKSRCESGTGGE